MSKIYQDTEGSYHDLTAANLAEWPPADESLLNQPLQTVDNLRAEGGEGGETDGNPGGATEFPAEIVSTPGPEVQTEGSGTVVESGSDVTPVATEPATAKAKTRKA